MRSAGPAPTIRGLLESVVAALQADDFAAAEQTLGEILAANCDQPDALHFLGILRHRQGDPDAAISLIQQALRACPDHAGIHLNLGNVLYEAGRARDAVAAYRQALDVDETSSEAWANLATVLHSMGELAPARDAGLRATALDPGSAEAWYGLSRTLIELGEVHQGLLANSRAIALWPRHLQAREQVVRALVLLDRRDEAAGLYREWLDEEPDNAVAHHQLAAVEGTGVPARASDAYVEAVFDSFAPQFDGKLAALQYRAPQRVADAVAAALPAKATLDVADLGCGTGLCGPLVRPWARRLVGCDLSTGMLLKARQRGCYDALYKVELEYFLRHESGSFDLLVCADTLCYFGPLDSVCEAAASALRAGGRFIFTVEALPDRAAPHRLQPSGRYAHSRGHLHDALAGFSEVGCTAADLRLEAGRPVAGWVVLATR